MRGLLDAPYLSDSHRKSCDQACYECLCRFGNQPWHGLLDWRLGLTTLAMLANPASSPGIDGDFGAPGLEEWPELARKYADDAAEVFAGSRRHSVAGIELVEFLPNGWMAVAHPLWDWTFILEHRPELSHFIGGGNVVLPATSFDLSRRLASTVERIRGELHHARI